MNSNDLMNKQLSKKEKKIKLIEARRRAILWSEREICERQLKAQARIETISLSEASESSSKFSRHSELQAQPITKGTISSLQKILKTQRQELDITIKVLSNHLNQLLLNSSKSKGHKRSKTDG